jgi:hypothetical protein
MNAIQSFWITEHSTKNGGWINKRYECISWSLSYFLLKKNFGSVQLYCNSEGRKFLVDELGLDYDVMHNELDNISDLIKTCWSMAKMYTYASQDAPFVHTDGDVFCFEQPDKDFLESDIFAQSLEMDEPLYRYVLASIKKLIPDYPDFLNFNKAALAANVGIVGGTRTDLFKEHYEETVKFLKNNLEVIENNHEEFILLYIYIEQAFLLSLANYHQIKLKFLRKPVFRTNFEDVLNFSRISPISKTPGYIHIIGSHKFRIQKCNLVEFWLNRFWPEQLEKINRMYPAVESSTENLSILLNPEYEKQLPDYKWIADKPNVVLKYPFIRTTTIFGINAHELTHEQLLRHPDSEKLIDCTEFEKKRIQVLTYMLDKTNAAFLFKYFEVHLDFCAKSYDEITDLKFELNESEILTSTYNWFNALNYTTQKYWYNLIIDSQKICFQEFLLSETECRILELFDNQMTIGALYLAWCTKYPQENNLKVRGTIHETLKELISHRLVRIC